MNKEKAIEAINSILYNISNMVEYDDDWCITQNMVQRAYEALKLLSK